MEMETANFVTLSDPISNFLISRDLSIGECLMSLLISAPYHGWLFQDAADTEIAVALQDEG